MRRERLQSAALGLLATSVIAPASIGLTQQPAQAEVRPDNKCNFLQQVFEGCLPQSTYDRIRKENAAKKKRAQQAAAKKRAQQAAARKRAQQQAAERARKQAEEARLKKIVPGSYPDSQCAQYEGQRVGNVPRDVLIGCRGKYGIRSQALPSGPENTKVAYEFTDSDIKVAPTYAPSRTLTM